MEDALARVAFESVSHGKLSLNPCCNGRCTRTFVWRFNPPHQLVLILVVMEDALAPSEI